MITKVACLKTKSTQLLTFADLSSGWELITSLNMNTQTQYITAYCIQMSSSYTQMWIVMRGSNKDCFQQTVLQKWAWLWSRHYSANLCCSIHRIQTMS